MSFKLLTEHNLEFLSLKGGCTGSSESTLFKIPHCYKVIESGMKSKYNYFGLNMTKELLIADLHVYSGYIGGKV